MLWRLAARMHARGALDKEDLVQAAALALMRSRDMYEPERGLKWTTYATPRARFAMVDALRDIDHIPRLHRSRLKAAGLQGEKILSLDHQSVEVAREGLFDGVWESTAEDRDMWAAVKRRLGDKVGGVVEMYYREDRTLFEIGRIMGLSESRTCQLLAKGLRLLRMAWKRFEVTEPERSGPIDDTRKVK